MNSFKDVIKQNRGYKAVDEAEERIEEQQSNQPIRFWLPPEADTKIVFLDDEPPVIEEHQIKIAGDWRNWFTCLRVVGDECPICNILEDNPYVVGFYTVIDTAEFTDRQGNTRRNEKRLFPAKFKTLQQLRRLSNKRDGLEYTVWDVYRSDPTAFNTGDVWDYEKRLTEDEVKQLNDDIDPFDYAEILEPKDASDLKEILQDSAEQTDDDTGILNDESKVQF